MRNKLHILYWIDVGLLALLAALVTTGVIMRWVLPPGSGGGTGRGAGHATARKLLDMTRHEWGDWHFWIAILLVSLLVIHLAMHLRWIGGATRRVLGLHRQHGIPQSRRPQHAALSAERS